MATKEQKLKLMDSIVGNTDNARSWMWAKNVTNNEMAFRAGRKAKEYRRRLNRMPTIIVGAGPSLDKNKKFLKAAKDRAFIISVDTAFDTVSEVVKPNAVIALEARRELEDLMNFEKSNDVILFTDLTIHPNVIKRWLGPIVWFSAGFSGSPSMDNTMEREFNDGKEIGRITRGGCVTNAAFALSMEILRADPIILVGADCGFYDPKNHHCKDQNDKIEELNNIEMEEDVYGDKIFTTQVLLFYKYWIEDIVKVRNSVTKIPEYEGIFINATEGGIIKEGWVSMRLQTVVTAYLEKKYNFDDFIDLDKEIVGKTKQVKKVTKSVSYGSRSGIKESVKIED